MSNLPIEWTKHIKDAVKKEEFEKTIRASQTIVSRLIELLDEQISGLDKQETSISDYETPSWSEKQAHRNGQRSTLRRLKDLLSPITPNKG